VADHSLKSTKDHWLGKPLLHQQPNPAKAYLKAEFILFIRHFCCLNIILFWKIQLFRTLRQILLYYSPVRHVY